MGDDRIRVSVPLDGQTVRSLSAGQRVLISGTVWAARDAAHRRLMQTLDSGRPLPFDICGAVIYYVGPTPPTPGRAVGSAGPTTSARMDPYAPRLIELGLRGMIGKGPRSPQVVETMKKFGAVYFAATGGAGALLATKIRSYQVVAYDDLGPEALARMELENFPAVVAIDATGKSLYER
ncbi:MAG: Fe-S-containing hydro-lyase [Planctomycetes bacterium]|nr:Fe-S-containing hydro-lyase [Planctomycetota bacterium]